jgi:YidC/Oxa1 family membrane protein insertase
MQTKLKETQSTGNSMDLMKLANKQGDVMNSPEFKEYLKSSKLAMLKMPVVQAFVFSSFFITLRRMSNYPIESLKEGGTLWFTDLTQSDMFYALPLMTSLSLFAVLKIGIDFGNSQS